jgi:hypothetical protein
VEQVGPATSAAGSGTDSVFSTITSAGGGAGGTSLGSPSAFLAGTGGSGGGAGIGLNNLTGGTGNTSKHHHKEMQVEIQ